MKKEEQVKILKSDLQQAVDGKLCMNVTQFANAFGVSRESVTSFKVFMQWQRKIVFNI